MARMGSRIAPAAQLSSGTQHRTATGNEDGATSGLQPASSTARMGARTAPPGQDRSPAGPHVRSAALGWAREAAPEQSWLTKSRRTWTDTGAGPGRNGGASAGGPLQSPIPPPGEESLAKL